MDHEWGKHKIDLRYIEILEMSLTSYENKEIEEKLNELDLYITNILVAAEKLCTKFSTHQLDPQPVDG